MPLKHRKIALMGYRSVGKSTLAAQYTQGITVEFYDPTIENTLTVKKRIRGQDYFVKLVDTAGQDEYSIFPAQYTMDVDGFCLVYSINNQKSFEVVRILYDKLIDLTGQLHVPITLVGNKKDLSHERAVTVEEGRNLAAHMNARFVEISAKQNNVVNELFENLILTIEKSKEDEPPPKDGKCVVS